ncbi:MAG: cobalt ECF transporter T component CbiQ [Firmicutes bacterium]|nr:cobalt ECF transporter T component CbiQ [Bacillota bacterium]
MLIIDTYAYTNKLKDTNPMLKFFLSMGLLFTAIIIKNIAIESFIIFFMAFFTIFIAKIPLKSYFYMLILPLSFLLLSILGILISVSKVNVNYLWSIDLFNLYFGISKATLFTTKHLLFRSISALTCTYFLVLTTPMNDLILVFKKLKLPIVFLEMSILIYRFIFIFLEEAKEIHIAQELRFGYSNFKNSYRSISSLIASLFIRIFKRYEDMKYSLAMKGFNNQFHI